MDTINTSTEDLAALEAASDPRVSIYLFIGDRNVAGVSSGSIVKGQTEEAIFSTLLPDFIRVLGNAYPKRTGLTMAADILESVAFEHKAEGK